MQAFEDAKVAFADAKRTGDMRTVARAFAVFAKAKQRVYDTFRQKSDLRKAFDAQRTAGVFIPGSSIHSQTFAVDGYIGRGTMAQLSSMATVRPDPMTPAAITARAEMIADRATLPQEYLTGGVTDPLAPQDAIMSVLYDGETVIAGREIAQGALDSGSEWLTRIGQGTPDNPPLSAEALRAAARGERPDILAIVDEIPADQSARFRARVLGAFPDEEQS